MQDRYVGDIGDFGKYGLLRALSGTSESGLYFSLGVVWYLVEPQATELRNNDGNLTDYLVNSPDQEQYRECDPPLYDTLKHLVSSDNRNVFAIKQSGILHDETVFYDSLIDNRNRQEWFADALDVTLNSELVFVDPDNGISNNAENKHTTITELSRFTERGQSLVIYQHSIREKNWIARIAEELKQGLHISGRPPRVWTLQWHRKQSRAYFIVAHPQHELLLRAKTIELLNSPWGKERRRWNKKPHFSLAYPPEGL